MRRLFDFLLEPMVYGLACAGLFILADLAFPRYTKFVVIGLAFWGLMIGYSAANQHGKSDEPPRNGPPDRLRNQ
jgi:hypothetical protein